MNNNCFQGFLSNCTAKNNEEYKTVLQKRMRAMLVLLLLGIVILSIVGVLMLLQPEFVQNSYYAGWFMGLSTGLILGSVLIILKLRRTMNNALIQKILQHKAVSCKINTLNHDYRKEAQYGRNITGHRSEKDLQAFLQAAKA